MHAITILLAALTMLAGAATTAAQTNYPERPVRILVGFTPGVAPDVTGRLIADKLAEAWNRPVVVENVTGAGGNIACDRVAKAPPDGYTLVLCGNGTLVINPSLVKMPFDPIKDLAPITQVFVAANILTVHPDVPAKSLPELVALARAEPGKLTYAHAGVGTSQHLAGELFKHMARLDIQPVAYRGSTAVVPDLLAGRVHIFFGNIVNVLPLVRENKLRAFAVTSRQRSPLAPDLPTMDEAGFPGFEAVPWFGLMAPTGTPQPIIEKLHRDTVKILALPDVRKRLHDLGLTIIGGSPDEFAQIIKTETPYWAKLIKEAGIKAE